MILTSPSKDVDQAPPVTTTFDPPAGRRVARVGGRIDWDKVERLYSFVRARAFDRLHEAEQGNDLAAFNCQRRRLLAIEVMFAQARRGHPVVVACAITFFRAQAMRDGHHPEFLGEWLGTTTEEPQAS